MKTAFLHLFLFLSFSSFAQHNAFGLKEAAAIVTAKPGAAKKASEGYGFTYSEG